MEEIPSGATFALCVKASDRWEDILSFTSHMLNMTVYEIRLDEPITLILMTGLQFSSPKFFQPLQRFLHNAFRRPSVSRGVACLM